MFKVDGLIRLMEGDNTGPINIGNPGEFTMIELAENVKEVGVVFLCSICHPINLHSQSASNISMRCFVKFRKIDCMWETKYFVHVIAAYQS